MRFFGYVLALAVLGGLGVLGLITGKYETSSACEAAKEAIRQEAPGIMAELAKRDGAFAMADQATRPFQRLRKAFEGTFSTAAAEGAARELEDKGALECASLVVYREVHPEGFRRLAVDQIMEKSADFARPPRR